MSWLGDLLDRLFGRKPKPPPPPGDVRAALFAAINAQRAAQIRPALRRDSRLDAAAQQWAEQLARDGYQHHSPSFGDRIKAAGYPLRRADENIHGGQFAPTAPSQVVADWMSDPPHRSTVLTSCPDAGAGVAQDAKGDWWWVLDVASS